MMMTSPSPAWSSSRISLAAVVAWNLSILLDPGGMYTRMSLPLNDHIYLGSGKLENTTLSTLLEQYLSFFENLESRFALIIDLQHSSLRGS